MKKGQMKQTSTFLFLLYLVFSMPFYAVLMAPVVAAAVPPKVELTSVDYVSSNEVVISWIDPTAGATNVEFYVYRDGVLVGTISHGEPLQFVDMGLTPYFNYQYEISVHEVGSGPNGEGTKSDVIAVLTKKDTDAPILRAIVVDNQPTKVLFNFTTDEAVSGIVRYWQGSEAPQEVSFERDTDKPFQTTYSIEVSGLSAGEAYGYSIEVCNENGVCTTSQEGVFFYGVDLQAPTTDSIVCPMAANKRLIAISGITESYATIDVSVNGLFKFSQTVSGTGQFTIDNIPLDPQPENQITLDITDVAGNTNQFVCAVSYDATPPNVHVDSLADLVSTADVMINVTTDEPISLQVFSIPLDDVTPPGTVPNLVSSSVDSTQITISWDEPSSDESDGTNDISNYVVYRDGVPIATTEANDRTYVDSDIISGSRYEYKVKAVDTSCNVGSFSNILYITAEQGTKAAPLPQEMTDFCTSVSPSIDAQINTELSEKISLRPGKNKIKIIAHDKAKNPYEKEFVVTYDNKRPEFEWTNLNDLSDGMVYVPEITLRGNVSEPATVHIIVNGGTEDEEEFTIETKPSGYFSTTVPLSRNAYANIDGDDTSVSATADRSSTKWPNQIEIYAEDPSGQKSKVEKRIVTYGLCGGGNTDWQINIENVLPNEMVPRHLMEGIATIGFTYELKYFGSALYDGEAPTVTGVQVKKAPINAFDRKDYDLDWINDGNIQINSINDKTYGYVQLKFDPVDVSGSEDMSTVEIENTLAKNHAGKCLASSSTFGLDLGDYDPLKIGCVKVPLIIEVTYDSPNPDERARTQKQCVDMSVMIQPRIPPSAIPEALLKSGIAITDGTVKTIDAVQKVTRPLRQYSMYGCLASYVGWGVTTLYESAACFGFLNGDSGLYLDYDDGAVTVVDKDGNDALESDVPSVITQAEQMLSCYNAKVASQGMWKVSNYVCDRVMCGSIPSFDKYVETKKEEVKNDKLSVYNKIAQKFLKKSSYCANTDVNESYADFKSKPMGEQTPPNKPFSDITKLNSKIISLSGFNNKDTGKTWGESYPDLCEEEYLYEYQSACIFSKPYKESYCAKLKSQGRKDKICNEGVTSTISDALDELKICKQSQNLPTHIRRVAGNYYLIKDKVGAGGQNIKLLTQDMAIADLNKEDWERGYVELDQTDNKYSIEEGAGIDFSAENFDGTSPQLKFSSGCTKKTAVERACECARGTSDNACCPEIGGEVKMPPAIASYFCEETKSEAADIIDPTSGLMESLRCLCFNAIDAYLTQVKQVMTMLRDCFTTILVTGDGNAGVCEQAVTVYVCDLLYTGLGCVKDFAKIGSGDASGELEGNPLRDVMDVISLAGTKIETGVNGRYGDTAIFNALFVEKKLFNSVCLFAFGLDWQLDLESLFLETSAIDIPIEPVMSCSANRRFQSFDPTTGIATYVYDVAPFLISGADGLSYDVSLVCTTGQCDDGLCDCAHVGEEKTFSRTGMFGQGTLNAGDVLNKQAFIVVDQTTDPYNKGMLRYDTVRLTARYKDNSGVQKVETQDCKIKDVGGTPPAMCFFDILSPDGPMFKCEVLSEDGATYFQIPPEAKKSTYCLRKDDGTIGSADIQFNQYSIIKKSKYPETPLSRYLKISVTDGKGNPIEWNLADAGNTYIAPITAEGQTMFGDQMGVNNIPIIHVTQSTFASKNSLGRCDVVHVEDSLTNIGETSKGTLLCDGFSAVKLTEHTTTQGTGADKKEVLTSVDVEFGEFDSNNNFITSSGDVVSKNYPVEQNELSYYSSGHKITLQFKDIKNNGVIYLKTASSSTTSSNEVKVQFEILDESRDSVIMYNNKPQRVSLTIPVTTECDTSTNNLGGAVTTLPTCDPLNGENLKSPRCLCGTEQCKLGQVCCLKSNEISSNVGFCGSFGDGITSCDSKSVIDSQIGIVEEDGVLVFSNIYDEFEADEISGDEIFLYITFTEETSTDSTSESFPFTYSSKRVEGISKTNSAKTSTRVPYEDISVYLSSVPFKLDKKYAVIYSFVDEAGNVLQNKGGTIIKSSSGYIYTST